MARTIADADGLTAAEVVHRTFTVFPVTATVAEVRAWFEESERHRMAFLADGDRRYAGSLTPGDLAEDLDPTRPAAEFAADGPTIAPGAPAAEGYAIAAATPARRVPVVDHDGRLLGVLSVTKDLTGFCGT